MSKDVKKSKTSKKSKNSEMSKNAIKKVEVSTPEDETPTLTSQNQKRRMPAKQKITIFAIIFLILAIIAAVCVLFFVILPNKQNQEDTEPQEESVIVPETPKYYSKLSGLEIASEDLNNSPAFCIQIPNGNDGARPQTGLNSASIVFETIAEAGITRFAAIYQNANDSVIGPIRSLRQYYLDWDTPFGCTIVHAGGSPEALASLRTGKWQDLTESTVYMWRDRTSYYSPNNLMTSSKLLGKFATDKKYTTSNPKTFGRYTESEADKIASENYASETAQKVNKFSINFGSSATYNTSYEYDSDSNSYLRSYTTGTPHMTYTCDSTITKENPTPEKDCGEAKQVNPSAVVAMEINMYLDTDRYHYKANTIGSGTATIFQNGSVIKGTWTKENQASQIIFKDSEGNEIKFTPGLLWIGAYPSSYGSVKY